MEGRGHRRAALQPLRPGAAERAGPGSPLAGGPLACAAFIGLLLAAGAPPATSADPCHPLDEAGRTFPACFDPGHGLELSAGGAGATGPGGGLDLRAAWRWRSDLRAPAGNLEWLREQDFLDLRVLAGGDPPRAPFEGAPRAGAVGGLAWRGTFVRRRASPFLLVPGPAPLRVPFPFDVGLLVEAGGAAWEADRPDRLRLRPLRAALLLDLARYAGARRLAFGPEVAWETDLERGRTPVSRVVPFTAGVVTARLESGSGLAAAELAARAGAAVLTSGGTTSLVEVVLSADRTVLAVNDRPVALFLAGSLRRGAPGAGAEVTAGIRLVAARARGR